MKQYKIYKISQEVNDGYDTYSEAVVIAENEEEAKKIHPNGEYNYNEHEDGKYPNNKRMEKYKKADRNYGTWARKEFVKVEYIGEAKKGSKKGVVVASFHAG